MIDLKAFLAVLSVLPFFFLAGNASATQCDPADKCPLSTQCPYNSGDASFYDFFNASTLQSGYVCHPNRNFEFFVGTGAFGSTPLLYDIISFDPNTNPSFIGSFISGQSTIQILFTDEFHPTSTSPDPIGLLTLYFVSFLGYPDVLEVTVEYFDQNDIKINEVTSSTSHPIQHGTSYSLNFVHAVTQSTAPAYINITYHGKQGFYGVDYE